VAAEVRRHLGSAVYETVIPRSVRLSEAPSHGLPIALYSPESKGAAAYARFAVEFRARMRDRERPRLPGTDGNAEPGSADATARNGVVSHDAAQLLAPVHG
jgi:hypothetical protein